jgi:HJR/Mrr/RecB family endonuclease
VINVIKATGEREPFSEHKIENSIRRAGIPHEIQDQVLQHVKSKLYENITTKEIYRHIIEFLKNSPSPYNSTKYNLKQGIMDLGPSGYPFEDYISEILKTQGYHTQTRQILKGKCISHEVDVIAEKDGKKIMIEAKFHNGSGTRSDVHVALYTKARFDDVKDHYGFSEAWIVTNTKATTDAITYAQCNDMRVVGWNSPEGGSLRELVEKTKLYPITSVASLSQSQKQILLLHQLVLCRDICANPSKIKILGLSPEKENEVLNELNFICGLEKPNEHYYQGPQAPHLIS